MRETDEKVRKILEKDYSEAVIKEGQEWYIGHGVFLECKETKDHLLDLMECYRKAVESALILRNVIEGELEQYHITDNLFGGVLDLSGCLSIIELYAEEYLHVCRHAGICEDELRTSYFREEEPFYKISDDDLPF